MARGSNGSGNNSLGEGFAYGLQQILEAPAHDLRDEGASGGALHELSQLGGATMGKGHRPAHPLTQLMSEGGEPSAPALPGLTPLSYTTPWAAAEPLRSTFSTESGH